MSERTIHRGKALTITINGKQCDGVYGQTILEIARQNDIYIPTMCYLTKVSPIASCRMCVVDVQGVEGLVLSCQEKAVDKAVIQTDTKSIFEHRQNIMKLYNVNHPLQCGVCDKSGECDLQNKTLEFGVSSQEFHAQEQKRKHKKWGILGYDPYLCIMCEKCVHTCNEVIGSNALYIKPGGYKSEIDIKFTRCEQCGDCISVCPVGALVSNGYKYSSNAWESNQVPGSCAHCSAGCSLYYDVKHNGVLNYQVENKGLELEKITRVTNDAEFATLCGAGRFGFDYNNANEVKDANKLKQAHKAFESADTLCFDSYITNEEAFILQKLKEDKGYKLYNHDAFAFKHFMDNYSLVTSNSLYSATTQDVADSDYIVMIGTKIARDNPLVKYSANIAVKTNRAEFVYMHPIDDESLHNKYTQFVKYEAGTEEGVLALFAAYLLKNNENEYSDYLRDLDIGYISAESNVGEEELELMMRKLAWKKDPVLVVGEDIYKHSRAENIAKIVGVIEKYSNFKVLCIPSQTNTLGVSLICDLESEKVGKTIGYNQDADYIISSYGAGDIQVPAPNQQEGTFVTVNKQLVNTNAALDFDGYCFLDIVREFLEHPYEFTIDYTQHLPLNKGFQGIDFDSLNFGFTNSGVDTRGYALRNQKLPDSKVTLEEVADLEAYDGTVIYRCEPRDQFNSFTAKAKLLKKDTHLHGSESFAKAAKIADGDEIHITFNNNTIKRIFKVDAHIKGTVALCPSFDDGLSSDLLTSGYRFKQVKIEKVGS